MTVNTARRARRRAAAPTVEPLIGAPPETLAIGEIDQTVFDCPKCSRPLAMGARRCPGCGTRLLIGVPISKASVFVIAGLAFGLLAGGAGGTAWALSRTTTPAVPVPVAVVPSAAPITGSTGGSGSGTSASAGPLASALPGTGGGGSTGTAGMPTSIQAAIAQATTINQRFAVDATALASALASRTFDASSVAQILRSMSADSLYAEQVATRVSGWSDSAAIGADLATLYRGIHDIAEGTLVASVRNETAYRDAARDMLTQLAAAQTIDRQIADLATANGLILPEPSTAP
jgi:hypothetical protein